VSLAGPAAELERYGDGHAAGDLTRIRGQLEPARPGLARQRSWTGTAAARRPCASGRRSTRSPQPAAARAPHRLRRRRHRRPAVEVSTRGVNGNFCSHVKRALVFPRKFPAVTCRGRSEAVEGPSGSAGGRGSKNAPAAAAGAGRGGGFQCHVAL
jgi:hypothetical protein